MLHFMIGLGILVLILSVPAGRALVFGALFLAAIGFVYLLSQNAFTWQSSYSPPAPPGPSTPQRPPAVIQLGDLIFRDLAPSQDSLRGNNNWVQLAGVVTNDSPYPLSSVTFKITVEDCTAPVAPLGASSHCTTVGNGIVTAAVKDSTYGFSDNHPSVPAKQARAISSTAVQFQGLPDITNGGYRKLSWVLTAAYPPSYTYADAQSTDAKPAANKPAASGTLVIPAPAAPSSLPISSSPQPFIPQLGTPPSIYMPPEYSPPPYPSSSPSLFGRPITPSPTAPPTSLLPSAAPPLTVTSLPPTLPPTPAPAEPEPGADSLNAAQYKALLAQHPEWRPRDGM